MKLDFQFLDYVWRGLIVGSLLSTTVLGLTLLLAWCFRGRLSATHTKWLFNLQFLLALAVFCASFGFVAFGDPELAIGCFDHFVKSATTFTITRLIAAAWLIPVVLLLALDALKIHFSGRRFKHDQALPSDALHKILKKLCGDLGLKVAPELVITKREIGPHVRGWIRHQIVLPVQAMRSFCYETWQSILAHETIHIKDRDIVWLSLNMLCRRLLFFTPLVWIASAGHRLAIEKSADEQALKLAGMEPDRFIKALLEVITFAKCTRPDFLAIGASRDFAEIKSRIEYLSKVGTRKFSEGLFVATLVLLVALTAGISFAQARSTAGYSGDGRRAGGICSQVDHERLLESWLRVEPPRYRCGQ